VSAKIIGDFTLPDTYKPDIKWDAVPTLTISRTKICVTFTLVHNIRRSRIVIIQSRPKHYYFYQPWFNTLQV